MSSILDYYKKALELHEVDSVKFKTDDGDVPFFTLTQKIDRGEFVSFDPNPLVNGIQMEQFILLDVDNLSGKMRPPGLMLENRDRGTKHLLIYHEITGKEKTAKEEREKFQNDLIERLKQAGIKNPMPVTRVTSAQMILNPILLEDENEDLWTKHDGFRFWSDLEKLPVKAADPNAIINPQSRFLCKGGSLLIVAPSGVGKSTLVMQMAASWAAGRDFFGLKPTKALRCFLLQGENDDGDLAEMTHGIQEGLGLSDMESAELRKNFTVQSRFGMPEKIGEVGKDGKPLKMSFAELLEELIKLHQPEVFFVDPLFAFLSGDFNSQEFGSENFRRRIDPVLKRTGCLLISTHHTPKPARETPRTGGVDFSYSGFGTSELTNWYRAVATLRPEKGLRKTFRFVVSKRGARAGFAGGLNYCLMRHSERSLFWEPVTSVVIASPDGPPSEDERESLALLKALKPTDPEPLEAILAKIMTIKEVRERTAAKHWARIKKYFMKVGQEYILIPPEETVGEPEPDGVWETASPHPPQPDRNERLKPVKPNRSENGQVDEKRDGRSRRTKPSSKRAMTGKSNGKARSPETAPAKSTRRSPRRKSPRH
jgi:hypothetical protein